MFDVDRARHRELRHEGISQMTLEQRVLEVLSEKDCLRQSGELKALLRELWASYVIVRMQAGHESDATQP